MPSPQQTQREPLTPQQQPQTPQSQQQQAQQYQQQQQTQPTTPQRTNSGFSLANNEKSLMMNPTQMLAYAAAQQQQISTSNNNNNSNSLMSTSNNNNNYNNNNKLQVSSPMYTPASPLSTPFSPPAYTPGAQHKIEEIKSRMLQLREDKQRIATTIRSLSTPLNSTDSGSNLALLLGQVAPNNVMTQTSEQLVSDMFYASKSLDLLEMHVRKFFLGIPDSQFNGVRSWNGPQANRLQKYIDFQGNLSICAWSNRQDKPAISLPSDPIVHVPADSQKLFIELRNTNQFQVYFRLIIINLANEKISLFPRQLQPGGSGDINWLPLAAGNAQQPAQIIHEINLANEALFEAASAENILPSFASIFDHLPPVRPAAPKTLLVKLFASTNTTVNVPPLTLEPNSPFFAVTNIMVSTG